VKLYRAADFTRYYRRPATRVLTPAERRRRVAAVVALAERWLDRRLRSVLDLGCGLGLWGRQIRELRPSASYLGFEPSPAAPESRRSRFEIRRGGAATIAALPPRRRFDLVLCVDVLHYLPAAEVDAALAALVPRARGLFVGEVLTSAEEIEGDTRGFFRRTPAWWRERFARQGLVGVGLHAYLPAESAQLAAALETLGAPRRPRRMPSA